MFNVVEFLSSKSVAVVSHAWMQGDTFCRWPIYKNKKKIEKACRNHIIPGIDWEMYAVRIMSSPSKLITQLLMTFLV